MTLTENEFNSWVSEQLADSDDDRAPDMALPRMNNWSFWILPVAFTMLLSTLFMDSGGSTEHTQLYT